MDFILHKRMFQNYQKNLHQQDVFAVHRIKNKQELRNYIFEVKFENDEETTPLNDGLYIYYCE